MRNNRKINSQYISLYNSETGGLDITYNCTGEDLLECPGVPDINTCFDGNDLEFLICVVLTTACK